MRQTISFEQQETTDMTHRIRVAWASVAKHRQKLTSRSYHPHHRLRLFNAVIMPSLLYGAGTWTLTLEHERMIRSTRRKMLLLIIQTRRRHKSKSKKRKRREGFDGRQQKPRYAPHHNRRRRKHKHWTRSRQRRFFVSVPDDDIDTAEVDEEDWIDFNKEAQETQRKTC